MAGRQVYYACKSCNFISEMSVCPRCGGDGTKDWQGMVAIADYEKSQKN